MRLCNKFSIQHHQNCKKSCSPWRKCFWKYANDIPYLTHITPQIGRNSSALIFFSTLFGRNEVGSGQTDLFIPKLLKKAHSPAARVCLSFTDLRYFTNRNGVTEESNAWACFRGMLSILHPIPCYSISSLVMFRTAMEQFPYNAAFLTIGNQRHHR